MAAKIYYEQDAPIGPLQGKKVAVVGYGSQGHAHSQNLRDSGIEVAVAELEGTDNFKLATEHGFKPSDIKTAIDGATLIIVTLPDEVQAKVYESQIAPEPQGRPDARLLPRVQHSLQVHRAAGRTSTS